VAYRRCRGRRGLRRTCGPESESPGRKGGANTGGIEFEAEPAGLRTQVGIAFTSGVDHDSKRCSTAIASWAPPGGTSPRSPATAMASSRPSRSSSFTRSMRGKRRQPARR
jgi:hypothetical protein